MSKCGMCMPRVGTHLVVGVRVLQRLELPLPVLALPLRLRSRLVALWLHVL